MDRNTPNEWGQEASRCPYPNILPNRFQIKTNQKRERGTFIQMEGIANQEDTTTLNVGAPESGHPVSHECPLDEDTD